VESRPRKERGIPFFPFASNWYLRHYPEPSWKQGLGLFFPLAATVVLGIEYLVGFQPTGIWLSFIAFSIAYSVLALLVFRKP
jgi:hypothetical protein